MSIIAHRTDNIKPISKLLRYAVAFLIGGDIVATAVTARANDAYAQKNSILADRFAPVSPLDYYVDMYGADIDQPRPYVTASATTRIHTAQNIDELLEIAVFRNDCYTPPASFFGRVSLDTLRRLYAFVIDLDNVSLSDLRLLISNSFFNLIPTYVVNSGNGLHLVYLLDEPVETFKSRIHFLNSLFSNVKSHFDNIGSYHVDHGTSLLQSYRVVGSQTKRGEIVQAFKTGGRWGIDRLAAALGITAPTTTAGQPATVPEATPRPSSVVPFPSARRGFYSHVLERMGEVNEGHRETAMFALAVIAYKCRIPRSQIEHDLKIVYDILNAKGTPMKLAEITKAMNGYQLKYIRTRAEKLESWLGFEFERTTKRNGRTRAEHLQHCREIRNERSAKSKIDCIAKYLSAHPTASNREISTALHMHMQTVRKYRATFENTGFAGGVSSIAFSTSPRPGGYNLGQPSTGEKEKDFFGHSAPVASRGREDYPVEDPVIVYPLPLNCSTPVGGVREYSEFDNRIPESGSVSAAAAKKIFLHKDTS